MEPKGLSSLNSEETQISYSRIAMLMISVTNLLQKEPSKSSQLKARNQQRKRSILRISVIKKNSLKKSQMKEKKKILLILLSVN